jgi:lipoprotein-releasing system ATP-binding protein
MLVAEVLLSAHNLTKQYTVGRSQLDVLRGVSIELTAGEIVAIVGESGAGKSTLLHLLGLLDRPTSGHIMFGDRNLSAISDDEMALFRNREIGFIFQFHHLLPEFTALENAMMPALIARKNREEAELRARYLLDRVGLSARLPHRPNELSGGELQRVAVARALINQPSIVLADEPSGNLDHKNSEMLHDLIWTLARENNCTFVIVTHDLELATKADRVFQLRDGLAEETGIEKYREQLIH